MTDTNETIFSKIIRKEIPADIVYEDDQILAFRDIAPKAPVHILVIPKKHIESLRSVKPEDQELLGYMLLKINEIATDLGLKEGGYRVISNAGPNAGQEVPHLHFHLLGGGRVGGLVGE